MSESGRKCRSGGDLAGSAEPRAARPSLSQALADLLARQPVAGSRPAPYRSAAQLCCRSSAHSGRQRTARQRGTRRSSPLHLTWTGNPVHGRRARVMSRAHETHHAPSPPCSTPNPGPRLRRWGLWALALEYAVALRVERTVACAAGHDSARSLCALTIVAARAA